MASVSNFPTPVHRHNRKDACNVFANKSISKMISQGHIVSRVTLRKQISAQFRLCQEKAMFQQHVNLMILTWIFAASNSSMQEVL